MTYGLTIPVMVLAIAGLLSGDRGRFGFETGLSDVTRIARGYLEKVIRGLSVCLFPPGFVDSFVQFLEGTALQNKYVITVIIDFLAIHQE